MIASKHLDATQSCACNVEMVDGIDTTTRSGVAIALQSEQPDDIAPTLIATLTGAANRRQKGPITKYFEIATEDQDNLNCSAPTARLLTATAHFNVPPSNLSSWLSRLSSLSRLAHRPNAPV